MRMQRFDVEETVNGACVDYLTVHDGSSTSAATLLDTFCDTVDETFNLTTTGNHVTFYFTSDENARLRGFEAVYVAYSERECKYIKLQIDICIALHV